MKRTISMALALIILFSAFTATAPKADAASYSGASSYNKSVYAKRLKAVVLTGNQRDDIANVAISQIGYHESSSSSNLSGSSSSSGNCTEYGRWYGYQAPWCAIFVSWCAAAAGVGNETLKKSASSSPSSFGVRYYSKGNYTPKKGDLIFYNYAGNGISHVGLIVDVSDGYITSVEGNTSKNCVAKKRRAIGFKNVVGYGAVKYSDNSVTKLSCAKNAVAGICIKWKPVKNATGYNIYRKTAKSRWSLVGSVSGGKKGIFTDTKAKNLTSYTYTVRACFGKKLGGYSQKGVTVLSLKTPRVNSVINTAQGSSVSWGKIAGAKGYYILRKTAGGNWKQIATVNSAAAAYSDKTVKSGVTYSYAVKAYYGKAQSSYKGYKSTYLSAPDILKAESSGDGIELMYEQVEGAVKCGIYRKSVGEEWQLLEARPVKSGLSYTDDTVSDGIKYTYAVRAINGNALSAPGNTAECVKVNDTADAAATQTASEVAS